MSFKTISTAIKENKQFLGKKPKKLRIHPIYYKFLENQLRNASSFNKSFEPGNKLYGVKIVKDKNLTVAWRLE